MRAFTIAAVLIACLPALAAAPPDRQHRVVVEVTGWSVEHWKAALDTVEDVGQALPAGQTQIDVVVYGRGLEMLLASNTAMKAHLSSLAAGGVKFLACQQSMRRMKIAKQNLFPFATLVDSGPAELVRKQEDGWAYLKTD